MENNLGERAEKSGTCFTLRGGGYTKDEEIFTTEVPRAVIPHVVLYCVGPKCVLHIERSSSL